MTARQTVLRLEAFAYAVRFLWGFHVIYSKTGHENLKMDWSYDKYPKCFFSKSSLKPCTSN